MATQFITFNLTNGPSHEDLMLAQYSRRPGETNHVTFDLSSSNLGRGVWCQDVPFLVLGSLRFGEEYDLTGLVSGDLITTHLDWEKQGTVAWLERRLAIVRRYNPVQRTGELDLYREIYLNPAFMAVPAR